MAQTESTFEYYRSNFGKDAMASIVVFLVALPPVSYTHLTLPTSDLV